MFRPAFRTATKVRALSAAQLGKRFASTTAARSGSWKGSAARWAAAGAIVYYYNTSSVFAEEPQYPVHAPSETSHESETYRTIDSIAEQRRAQARSSLRQAESDSSRAPVQTSPPDAEQVAVAGPDALEEEADQQGAFNEETGEINWDCPCLGGMAHGPCGEQFRAAFSCFVFSKEEPKGVDCIEHFKTMQSCFREHPDEYGSEMEEEEVDAQLNEQNQQGDAPIPSEQHVTATSAASHTEPEPKSGQRAQATNQIMSQDTGKEEQDSIPTAWHDSRQSSSKLTEK